MPYVAIDMSRREELLPAIQTELVRVAELGFTGDIEWRNIGLRKDENGTEKIVVVNLESLVPGRAEILNSSWDNGFTIA